MVVSNGNDSVGIVKVIGWVSSYLDYVLNSAIEQSKTIVEGG